MLDKEDSSEEMSIPGSPHNEAIQHSSVSTSNGVSSSTASGSATEQTIDQSTEGEESSTAPATHTQPAKSWSGFSAVTFIPGSHVDVRLKNIPHASISLKKTQIHCVYPICHQTHLFEMFFKMQRDGTLQTMGKIVLNV